jgi:DinB superfamily
MSSTGAVTNQRDRTIAQLQRAESLMRSRIPGGRHGGWDDAEVVWHLTAYTRAVAAVLRGAAEARQPSSAELFGRELTADELSLELDEQNEAIRRQYADQARDAIAEWRSQLQAATGQAVALSDEVLEAPGPTYLPAWTRPHLYEVVDALVSHYEAHLSPP